jgi:peptidoglycan/LPS O-acetylase OafA/YrhL
MGASEGKPQAQYRYPLLTRFCGFFLICTFFRGWFPFEDVPDNFTRFLTGFCMFVGLGVAILWSDFRGSKLGQSLAGFTYGLFSLGVIFQNPFDGYATSMSEFQFNLIYAFGILSVAAMCLCLYDPRASRDVGGGAPTKGHS